MQGQTPHTGLCYVAYVTYVAYVIYVIYVTDVTDVTDNSDITDNSAPGPAFFAHPLIIVRNLSSVWTEILIFVEL